MLYKMYPARTVAKNSCTLKMKFPVSSLGRYPCVTTIIYPEHLEQHASSSEYDGIANEGFSRESCNTAALPNFEDDKGESKGLDCTCKSKDERKLAAAELDVDEGDDGCEDAPRDERVFLDVFHLDYYKLACLN